MYDASTPVICCFKEIRFKLSRQQVHSIKWRTSKARELFAYLLHHRGQTVYRDQLVKLLWADMEEEKAAKQLHTSIYHIRQTLKSLELNLRIAYSWGKVPGYRLEMQAMKVDVEEWERAVNCLDKPCSQSVAAYEHVLHAYEGDYLGSYDYQWAVQERQRYRRLWLLHMRELSRYYEREGNIRKAIAVNQHVQQLLPDECESCFSLMKLFHQTGDRELVEEQYEQLRSQMSANQKAERLRDVAAWYEQWKKCD
ncbi:AfsR/SARP family transcriptional regulator [Paenibacillus chungangensis]|uniref:Winged helix-turn-helix domain-containing protein n=1 Tax=Paenibacillus chungangensis TaxID=696535 RepID=A0ABW3HNZ8_9BACL